MEKLFKAIQELVTTSKVVIERPKGSAHPRYPDYIYPLNYGYLDDTSSSDNNCIDVWTGSGDLKTVTGILVVVDPVKKDSEIKVLIGCDDDESAIALESSNRGDMAAILIKNGESIDE